MLLITQEIKEKQRYFFYESLGGIHKVGCSVGRVQSHVQRWAQSPRGRDIQQCRTCSTVVTVVVLLPQTKEVTKAMNEKKFEDAMKLRGR